MKRLLFILLFILSIFSTEVYATNEPGGSGELSNNVYNSGDTSGEINYHSGDVYKKYEDKKLSEEGASVDTSVTQQNYNVETPTIVLLTLFGILTVISLILFVLKI